MKISKYERLTNQLTELVAGDATTSKSCHQLTTILVVVGSSGGWSWLLTIMASMDHWTDGPMKKKLLRPYGKKNTLEHWQIGAKEHLNI